MQLALSKQKMPHKSQDVLQLNWNGFLRLLFLRQTVALTMWIWFGIWINKSLYHSGVWKCCAQVLCKNVEFCILLFMFVLFCLSAEFVCELSLSFRWLWILLHSFNVAASFRVIMSQTQGRTLPWKLLSKVGRHVCFFGHILHLLQLFSCGRWFNPCNLNRSAELVWFCIPRRISQFAQTLSCRLNVAAFKCESWTVETFSKHHSADKPMRLRSSCTVNTTLIRRPSYSTIKIIQWYVAIL